MWRSRTNVTRWNHWRCWTNQRWRKITGHSLRPCWIFGNPFEFYQSIMMKCYQISLVQMNKFLPQFFLFWICGQEFGRIVESNMFVECFAQLALYQAMLMFTFCCYCCCVTFVALCCCECASILIVCLLWIQWTLESIVPIDLFLTRPTGHQYFKSSHLPERMTLAISQNDQF